jgi:hypothetical protein
MILERALRVVAALLVAAVAWQLPDVRRQFVRDLTLEDAVPGGAPALPAVDPDAEGLATAPFVRVILVDGVNLEDARRMPAWDALCGRGLDLVVDVGFPTVSLPVQVALWSGLTQQQTGVVFHSGYPLRDPLGARGIPAQVPGSIAIAESHPYIVQSLGFTDTRPPLEPKVKKWGDQGYPDDWGASWEGVAQLAIESTSPLVFVHVLRVDVAGHARGGRRVPLWDQAVGEADAILARLIAAGDRAHPDARWFLLSDHGHVDAGGHGGEEASIRRVRACVAGVGIEPGQGGPLALVDLSRAIADSVGATLPAASRGRPLPAALDAPLAGDELIPAVPSGRILMATAIMLLGAAITAWALGRRAVIWGPWWWPVALLAVLVALGPPSLSSGFLYKHPGDTIADPARIGTWGAAAFTAAAVLLAGKPGWRIAIAQVALPLAGLCATLALCGGLPVLWGETTVPVAPRWTAWASVAMVITARGLWAVALALLATAVLPSSGPWARWGTRRSAP